MLLNQENKGKLLLIAIALLFFLPIIASWYLVFFSDYKKNTIGTQHGELIAPVIDIGEIKAREIKTMGEVLISKKWTLVFIQKKICGNFCKERFYQLKQIRLALGEDRNKVERLVIFNKPNDLKEFKDLYPSQKFIDNSFKDYYSLVRKFDNYISDEVNPIFLIDPYGFLMMQYSQDSDPMGIIKDLEKLIKNSK
jgi:cytochrome oxidase Cu insertion factor (SCO1/SenC/PrrC family)